jgi:hypothetical protein
MQSLGPPAREGGSDARCGRRTPQAELRGSSTREPVPGWLQLSRQRRPLPGRSHSPEICGGTRPLAAGGTRTDSAEVLVNACWRRTAEAGAGRS